MNQTDYKDKDTDYYNNSRDEMLEFIPADCSIFLEIGCGIGSFGKSVKYIYKNAEYWGIELNTESAGIASNHLDKIFAGDVFELLHKLPDNYFDCLVMNDVIEHLVDPMIFLKTIRPKLKNKAWLIASIPNVRYITNFYNLIILKDWQYENFGILDKTHLRFFTEKSIVNFFKEENFKITKLKGINPVRSYIFYLLNFMTFGFFNDTKFLQFGVSAKFPESFRID